MLFALGALATFLIGGVTGIFLGSAAVDIFLHDTYFVVAHFHYTLFPAAFFGGFAGLYYWYPKMFGRMLDERLGRIHFWLTLVAFNAVFLPLFAVGLGGHMRRIYNPMQYDLLQPLQPIHRFVTFAAIVLLLGQLPKRRRARLFGVAAALLGWPGAASDCPRCYGASDARVLDTYYLSTVMLSLLPFGLVAVGILVARRLAR